MVARRESNQLPLDQRPSVLPSELCHLIQVRAYALTLLSENEVLSYLYDD